MGIEHVGLGADFVDQVKPDEQPVDANAERQSELAQVTKSRLALEDLRGPEDFPSLVTALRMRGYEGSRLEAMLSGNWLRILRDGLPA
jgi:membrane dipeptidase